MRAKLVDWLVAFTIKYNFKKVLCHHIEMHYFKIDLSIHLQDKMRISILGHISVKCLWILLKYTQYSL